MTRALAADKGYLWARGREGLGGSGAAFTVPVGTGEGRFGEAAACLAEVWRELGNPVAGEPCCGPVAFGSFTFDPLREGSSLIVPTELLRASGRRGSATSIGSSSRRSEPASDHGATAGSGDRAFKIRYGGSSISEIAWLEAVTDAAAAIGDGILEKVVLARDVIIWSEHDLDLGLLARRLMSKFPQCYTFAFEGFVGATPELLVRRRGKEVDSLILAGSARRGTDPREDERVGRELLTSDKDLAEHEPAVRSVVEMLKPLCRSLEVPESPALLRLANVQHLATHVKGVLGGSQTALDLAGMLHPTAAICGLPRGEALDFIRRREGLDRSRYSGPVGWVDARGDGEWGIALRCAEIEGARGRLFAGSGIVGHSVPADELEETRLKLRAMMSALEQVP